MSDSLAVDVLNPETDRDRFGLRYCTGGYIFQIRRGGKTPLLTGPTYPDTFVPVHGQGFPDTFNHVPLFIADEDLFMITGIGKCDLKNGKIIELTHWDVEKKDDEIKFRTIHKFSSYEYTLTRRIKVSGDKVISHTTMENRGKTYVPVSWYPHPFFPPKEEGLVFTLKTPFSFENETGFFRKEGNGIYKNRGIEESKSFQVMKTESVLHVLADNDTYECEMKTDYISAHTPVWANDNTSSIEPYYDTTLFPGCTKEWTVSYEFRYKD